MRSWFTPPFGSGGQAFRVFWELQASTGGRLQHRKGTNSPTLAPGPCRRQLEQHRYQEPKLGNNKYVEQQGIDCQINPGRPSQWNSMPFNSSWRALNYIGRIHRIFSEEAANTMLSLSLCTHSRAHTCVPTCTPACTCQHSTRRGSALSKTTGDRRLVGRMCPWSPRTNFLSVTDYLLTTRANVLWHWRVGGHHLNQVIKLSVTNRGPASIKCLPAWCTRDTTYAIFLTKNI